MGSILVVSGPPGAGKSAVAAAVADRSEHSFLVDGDAFFGFIRQGGLDPWLPAAAAQNATVISAGAAAASHLAAGRATVVYDGVVGPWYLPTFLAAARGATCGYAVILPPVEQCLHRIRARSGHVFDDEDVTAQLHAEFTQAAIDERHLFTNPTGSLGATVEAVITAHAAGILAPR